MKIPVVIASGGGAIQGGIILLSLLIGLIAVSFGVYSALRKKKELSTVAVAVCSVAVFVSAFTAYLFGLPYNWNYWGAYLPWIPLALSLGGAGLTLRRKKA